MWKRAAVKPLSFFIPFFKFRRFSKYGLKGQQALSPGHRPGCLCMSEGIALKGQKHYSKEKAFALSLTIIHVPLFTFNFISYLCTR